MEGGRRKVDLPFPLCGFVVLVWITCVLLGETLLIPAFYSFPGLLCFLILNLHPQIKSR